jgi:hypothetical protein
MPSLVLLISGQRHAYLSIGRAKKQQVGHVATPRQ